MTERTPAAGKRMLDTPSTKDEIAVQHRPENAGSRHSALRPTEADGEKRGGDPKAGPKPDSDEVDPDRNVDTETWTPTRIETVQMSPDMPPSRTGRDSGLGTTAAVGTLPDDPRIQRLEKLADWLDTKFRLPVVNYPIGLDGIIGLIPGVGDTVTTALSSYLIYEAHKAGAPKSMLGRMGWNVGVDWLLGTIPVVGDIFDVAHKANAKNARLLLDHLRKQQGRARVAETPLEAKLRDAA